MDDEPYQVVVSEDWQPGRRNVEFFPCHDTPINDMLNDLEFIEGRQNWGYKFRFGFFEINQHDFEVIAVYMRTQNN